MTRVLPDWDAFLHFLDPGYDLDPGAVGAIAELAREELAKSTTPVKLVATFLSRPIAHSARPNVVALLREVVSQQPELRRRLGHACNRKGVIPKNRRTLVAEALAPASRSVLAVQRIVRPAARQTYRLQLNAATTTFSAIPSLISQLAALDPANEVLELEVGDFVYAAGLAVVAAWCALQPDIHRVEFSDDYSRNYCARIGFLEAIEGVPNVPDESANDWAVRLTPIVGHMPAEDTTERMLAILDVFINPSQEERSGLAILLGEIIENVVRHADAANRGFVVAQVYPRRLKLGITIADAGMGIPQSFRESGLPEYTKLGLNSEFFLRQALKALVTSKPSRHSGYGLYLLSKLIAQNHGSFLLASDTCSLVGYARGHELRLDSVETAAWKGTVVSLIIDLKRSLPVSEVYRSLPLPPGYSEGDFFAD